MKRITPTLLFVTFLALTYGSSLSAQEVDTTLYRDYNPNAYTHSAPYAARRARAKEQMRRGAPARTLPDHVNNAETKYFPPIINQDGGSCGSAQNIGYMLTYELNCYRNTDASLPENQLPTHFTWLLTGHNSDKEVMARTNGVPNVTTYGDAPIQSFLATRHATMTTSAGCRATTSGTPPCGTVRLARSA